MSRTAPTSAVAAALVEALRALPAGAKPHLGEIRREIALELGDCTPDDIKSAIQSLRYQGKLHWSRLELSPSVRCPGDSAKGDDPSMLGEPEPDADYPSEVNDEISGGQQFGKPTADAAAGECEHAPRQPSTFGLRGRHAAASRAAARAVPPPRHEPEIARQVREEANQASSRRRSARSTGTVRSPLELAKFGVPDMSLSEAVTSLLAEQPHDLIAAVNRKHPLLWRRVVLLARATGQRPAAALYAALERGLDDLERTQTEERHAA